jgi:hypothetical protein
MFHPFAVKSGEANRDRLIETMSGRVFILFMTSVKQDDIPDFEPDLTAKGSTALFVLPGSYTGI